MLKKRTLTAICLVSLVIVILWAGQPWWFTILAAVWGLVAVFEFYRMTHTTRLKILTGFGLIWTLLFIISPHFDYNFLVPLLLSTAVILPLAFAYIRAEHDMKRLTGGRDGMAEVIRAMREGFGVLKELRHPYALDSLRRLEGLPMMLAVPYLRRELSKDELDYVFTRGEAMTGELEVLDEEFTRLRASTSVQTPTYYELRKSLEK